ncbi:MAG TPA: AMP-binding protein, partial [Bryobacteraceae bacterium]|nr:AMP-binding protein [Bryobacteraceae bacterium]
MVREAIAAAALECGRILIGGRFAEALAAMRKAQWLDREELVRRSGERLTCLLRHAAANVPFYTEQAARMGLDAARLDAADLERFPVLCKAGYRSRPAEMFYAANVPEARRIGRSTSGSTGEPFRFAIDSAALPVIFASHLFYDSWFGLMPFDRYLRIAAPPASLPPAADITPLAARVRSGLMRRAQQWYEGLTQEKIAIWEVTAERAGQIWRRIERFRPAFIMGYTATLAALADELRRRGLELSRPVRGVITIAETLSPERRRTIEGYFRAPLINRYGLRELGSWCAQTCAVSPERLHLNTELVVCEILGDDGAPAAAGEPGRVVLTDLHNYARPFIRYDTGDMAALGGDACPCGRGFPLLGPIAGR